LTNCSLLFLLISNITTLPVGNNDFPGFISGSTIISALSCTNFGK